MSDIFLINRRAIARTLWASLFAVSAVSGAATYFAAHPLMEGLGFSRGMLAAYVAAVGLVCVGAVFALVRFVIARNLHEADEAELEELHEFHENSQRFVEKQKRVVGVIGNQLEVNDLCTAHLKSIIAKTDSTAREIIQSSGNIENSLNSHKEMLSEINREGMRQAEESTKLIETNNKTLDSIGDYMQSRASELEQDYLNVTKLAENARNLTGLVKYLKEISDQTNLLALNAAIEAARAGEHGRGFAIVADEVRKLSHQSEKASQKIGESIISLAESIEAKFKHKLDKDSGAEDARLLGGFRGQLKELSGAYDKLSSLMAETIDRAVESSERVSVQAFSLLNSTQFQDITRQQIEVIMKVNDEVNEKLAELVRCLSERDCCEGHCTMEGFDMDRVRDYYTMRKQREVHDKISSDNVAQPASREMGEGDVQFF